jgi:predicted AAA+ superfamily ATPase
MIERQREIDLIKWKDSPSRKPLLVRGARQVGKSYLIESFGKKYFQNCITINFEKSKDFSVCFENLDPKEIIKAISLLSQQKIIPGSTLLFLDEIQDCPNAIRSLRYFKENMPDLHVIGAGSLLELKLNESEFRFPVGRVSFMFLYPLSFKEFLVAFFPEAASYLTEVSLKNPFSPAIHEHFLRLLKQYFLYGGMPEVLAAHQKGADLNDIIEIQASVINTYRNDLGHYDSASSLALLRHCFDEIPLRIGQQIMYSKLAPDSRSRDLKIALSVLEQVNIIHPVFSTSASGLPLAQTKNEKKFKYFFLDVGLIKRINQLDANVLLNEDLMLLNQGALAEQFVAQELLAYAPYFEKPELYFWARDGKGQAEVDFISVIQGKIFPIEVKSAPQGTLRSLHQYQKEHNSPFGIKLSLANLSYEKDLFSIPIYLISELERLVTERLTNPT